MQTSYTPIKIYNEIELCEVTDNDCRKEIERIFLQNRISYYMRWPRTSLFSSKKDCCIICVNENSVGAAEELVRALCDENGYHVKFILKHSANRYL